MSAAGFGPRPTPLAFYTYTPLPGGGLLTLIGSATAGNTQLRLGPGKPGDYPPPRNGPSWSDDPAAPHFAPFTYVGPAALAQDF